MRKNKFLILRAYEAGMGSCIMHVVNGLVYAELTNRIPIVYWKESSLYYEPGNRSNGNVFEYYFKPVSEYCIYDLLEKGYSYFPRQWNDKNIITDLSFWPKVKLPATLNDSAMENSDVLVSCYLQRIEDIIDIIPKSHDLYGLSKEMIWYKYFNKYIRLTEQIDRKINEYYKKHMKDSHVLGVHLRKTDKRTEQAVPLEYKYIKAINKYIEENRETKIFLATDSASTIRKFEQLYADRLLYTNALRSENSLPVHFSHGNNRKKGEDIIVDIFLLSKCDYFIGSLASNIAYVVLYMINDPIKSNGQSLLITVGQFENISFNVSTAWKKFRRVSSRTKNIIRRIINS